MLMITGASGTVGKAVLHQILKTKAAPRAIYRSQLVADKAPAGTSAILADFANTEHKSDFSN